jgi:hypothetical protein
MSNLTFLEKNKLEEYFGMSSGYVMNFSDRTFREFIFDSVGKGIYDQKYHRASGSKAIDYARSGQENPITSLGSSSLIFWITAWRINP